MLCEFTKIFPEYKINEMHQDVCSIIADEYSRFVTVVCTSADNYLIIERQDHGYKTVILSGWDNAVDEISKYMNQSF